MRDDMRSVFRLHLSSQFPCLRYLKYRKKKAAGFDARGLYESKIDTDHAMGAPRGRIMDIIRFSKLLCVFIRSVLFISFWLNLPQLIIRVKKRIFSSVPDPPVV